MAFYQLSLALYFAFVMKINSHSVDVMEPRVPCTPAAGPPRQPTNKRQGAPLQETGGLRERWGTSPRDTSRGVQDLAISRLPEGLAELPSARGISEDAVKMPSQAGRVGVKLLEDDTSHDAYGRGVKVQVCLHKASWPLPTFLKVRGGRLITPKCRGSP